MLGRIKAPDVAAYKDSPARAGRLHLAEEMGDGKFTSGGRPIEVVVRRIGKHSGGWAILGAQKVETGAALLRLEAESLQARVERAGSASRSALLCELRPFG